MYVEMAAVKPVMIYKVISVYISAANKLTPWNGILLEKLTVTQLV
jgi:hypothetical protein